MFLCLSLLLTGCIYQEKVVENELTNGKKQSHS